jgi:hypothetical protein
VSLSIPVIDPRAYTCAPFPLYHTLFITRSTHSYVLDKPHIFNPMDKMFVALNSVFPLDYIFIVILILFFFIASIAGSNPILG